MFINFARTKTKDAAVFFFIMQMFLKIYLTRNQKLLKSFLKTITQQFRKQIMAIPWSQLIEMFMLIIWKIFSKTTISFRNCYENQESELQVNHKKCINEILKSLKSAGRVSIKQYNTIKPVGSRPGVLYDLCKVHKAIDDVGHPLTKLLSFQYLY